MEKIGINNQMEKTINENKELKEKLIVYEKNDAN